MFMGAKVNIYNSYDIPFTDEDLLIVIHLKDFRRQRRIGAGSW